MKVTISKNGRFVQITPKPNRDIPNGIKVYLSSVMYPEQKNSTLPIATTNIVKGQSRYYLPEGVVVKIIKAVVKLI